MERTGPSTDCRRFGNSSPKHATLWPSLVPVSALRVGCRRSGSGGYWRKYQATQLATPEAFADNPSLVWEFYHYRRELMVTKQPNAAHKALAELEARLKPQGRKMTVVTQNIDGLHHRAGSQDVIELHGSLFHTRCTKCSRIEENRDSPICPALKDRGEPDVHAQDARISVDKLPSCSQCGGLLRPHVVWFGEPLEVPVMDRAQQILRESDLCLLVGTSSVVYPAAGFAPMLASRGVPVAEFNLEETPVTGSLMFQFKGKCGEILPPAIAPHPSETST